MSTHIRYISKSFQPKSQAIINQANEIIAEYQAQGFDLTLRQLYYQFVARDLIPNTQKSYNSLGSIINDARLAGLIDWEAIIDRTQNMEENSHWSSPDSIIESCARQFRYDLWARQSYRPEVWIEKEALIGVIERVCIDNDVPYFACRGYNSQSEQWRAGRRFKEYLDNGQQPIVLHFGDHDPSGIDMSNDNRKRLSMFAEAPVELQRLALNMDQVEQYNPPPNPTKLSDSRSGQYVLMYGYESWELDALEPSVIEALIQDQLEALRDEDEWEAAVEEQDEARAQIQTLSDRWNEVIEFLED